jgi:hypothetical protein
MSRPIFSRLILSLLNFLALAPIASAQPALILNASVAVCHNGTSDRGLSFTAENLARAEELSQTSQRRLSIEPKVRKLNFSSILSCNKTSPPIGSSEPKGGGYTARVGVSEEIPPVITDECECCPRGCCSEFTCCP